MTLATIRRLADAQRLCRTPDHRIMRLHDERGHRFAVFENDQALRQYLQLHEHELESMELHTVIRGNQPRTLHMDFEVNLTANEDQRELRERLEDSLVHYRTAVFNEVLRQRCGMRYDQEHLMEVRRCERDPDAPHQTRLSVHLVWPQVVLQDNMAELRCVVLVGELARQLGARVLHDHALYRVDPDLTKCHSLRLAGCAKYPVRAHEVLHLRGPHPHYQHDPSWVDREDCDGMVRFTLRAEQFPVAPEEARLVPPAPAQTDAPRARPNPELMSFHARCFGPRPFDDCDAWRAPDTVHFRPRAPLLALAGIRGVDEVPWRKLAYLHLSSSSEQDRSFESFWRTLEHLRPRMLQDRQRRREKYRERYQSFQRWLPHWPRPYSLQAMLRLLDLDQSCPDALAQLRFCPLSTRDCFTNYAVTCERTTQRVFVECFSCGSRRIVGEVGDQHRSVHYFCSHYLNQHLGFDTLAPQRTTLAVCSNMGTGKTTWLREQLQHHGHQWPRVLCVSVRRSLADCLSESLGLKDYRQLRGDYAGYLEDDKNPRRWMVVQMESLKSLGDSYRKSEQTLPMLDLLVLDEYMSLCKQMLSTTMHQRHRQVWAVFEALVRRAHRVVVLDADYQPREAPHEFLVACRGELETQVYYNRHLPVPLKRMRILDYSQWYTELLLALQAGRPVSIVSGSRAELEGVHRAITEQMVQEEPDRDMSSQLYSSQSPPEVRAQVPQCNVRWEGLDAIGITPVVTVGVDYQGDPRLLAAMALPGSCDAETIGQMLGRFRRSEDCIITVLPGPGIARKYFRPPLTCDEVIVAANTKAREYQERLQQANYELDVHSGVYNVVEGSWADRVIAWGVARRWQARHDYAGVFQQVVLSHGDVCEDHRRCSPETPQRPELVQVAIKSDRNEQYQQRIAAIEADPELQREIKQTLRVDLRNERELDAKALAYLERCAPQVWLFRAWRQLGTPADPGRALELLGADMQAHGEWVGRDLSHNPLYDLLMPERNSRKPLPLNNFQGDLLVRVAALLEPFMRRAHRTWVPAVEFVSPQCEYAQQEWFEQHLLPLRRPENGHLITALRPTDVVLARPCTSPKSLAVLLRNALALFDMRFEVRKEVRRRHKHTYWRFDFEREEQLNALLEDPEVNTTDLRPLFI